MHRLIAYVLYWVMRISLKLRYRITVKGLDKLEPKPGGTLLLANHPAEIDPVILLRTFWTRYHPHPVAIDYLFQYPFSRFFLRRVGGISVPNFEASANSYKRRQIEKTYDELFRLLDRGESLLIYPSGGLKRSGKEVIGGASGVHNILQHRPDVNVLLIRTTGLWGSSLSKAITGETPDLVPAFFRCLKVILKNLIFFTPRRDVLIEVEEAAKEFPRQAPRRELNRYLEEWYNARGEEPLTLVSYSFWKRDLPQIHEKKASTPEEEAKIPEGIAARVREEIAQITKRPESEIKGSEELATDLGMDSLDRASLMLFLKEQYGIVELHATDLTDVHSVMAFAAGLRKSGRAEEQLPEETSPWPEETERPATFAPEGSTLMEAFLRACDRMDHFVAATDLTSGVVTYRKLKLGALVLAEKIRQLPGKYIGIMMPASVGVNLVIVATQLAGKIPVMINWTLGPRNLNAVVQQTDLQTVISSWQFLNRLENVELDGIDDKIVLIEDLRRSIGLFAKLGGVWHRRKPCKRLLKQFRLHQMSPEETAVVLFTSGTESLPKGVPLSHANLLANQRDAYSYASITRRDVMLGALPPFHSFGFSVTGLFPLLIGLRVAFLPNPTDGRRLAQGIKQWEATFLCLAPTFLKNLFRVATPEQLRTLRIVVSGAEKMPADLYTKLEELNNCAELIEGYGITECGPILTLNPPGLESAGVGRPLPSVELKIVNPETHRPQAQGEEGLILARGPNIFSGYLDRSLASPFLEQGGNRWYETGDLGFLDRRGYLTLSGRLKRFIKIGGEMVSLNAIEEVLLKGAKNRGWPLQEEAASLAVCALEEEGKKGEIHLFTTFDLSVVQANDVLKSSGMSNLIRLSAVHQIPVIPLLGTGKIDYRTLTQKLAHGNT